MALDCAKSGVVSDPSKMPGMDETSVAPKRAEVLASGSQADIAVRMHREKRDSLKAQQIS